MDKRRPLYREYLEAALIAVVFLQFVTTFVVQTFYIPSGSMENTLLVGDRLFVNRFIFGPTPTGLEHAVLPARSLRRGDVVIFRSPEDPTITMVKRCVAVPGDEVRIEAKQLYINGQRVDDSAFAIHRDAHVYNASDYPSPGLLRPQYRVRDYFGPLTVPEGHYFCLGDNRDGSRDSRYWGLLPVSYVKGRAVLIYWSYGGGTPDGTSLSLGERLVHIGRTLVGFIPETRWGRTFQLIR